MEFFITTHNIVHTHRIVRDRKEKFSGKYPGIINSQFTSGQFLVTSGSSFRTIVRLVSYLFVSAISWFKPSLDFLFFSDIFPFRFVYHLSTVRHTPSYTFVQHESQFFRFSLESLSCPDVIFFEVIFEVYFLFSRVSQIYFWTPLIVASSSRLESQLEERKKLRNDFEMINTSSLWKLILMKSSLYGSRQRHVMNFTMGTSTTKNS